jgi:hypothetical protein
MALPCPLPPPSLFASVGYQEQNVYYDGIPKVRHTDKGIADSYACLSSVLDSFEILFDSFEILFDSFEILFDSFEILFDLLGVLRFPTKRTCPFRLR